jgi:hypothetical protein
LVALTNYKAQKESGRNFIKKWHKAPKKMWKSTENGGKLNKMTKVSKHYNVHIHKNMVKDFSCSSKTKQNQKMVKISMCVSFTKQ